MMVVKKNLYYLYIVIRDFVEIKLLVFVNEYYLMLCFK